MRYLAALLCATALVGCGGDDEEPTPAATEPPASTAAPAGGGGGSGGGGGASSTLDVVALEPFAFDPDTLEAKAGTVTLDLELPADLQAPHAITIEGNGVSESSETVSAGASTSVSAELEPGEYTYYCPVGSHRADGMEGTLSVQ